MESREYIPFSPLSDLTDGEALVKSYMAASDDNNATFQALKGEVLSRSRKYRPEVINFFLLIMKGK